jgi:hypothetical protein
MPSTDVLDTTDILAQRVSPLILLVLHLLSPSFSLILHRHCHTIDTFPLTANFPFIAPEFLRPKTQIAQDSSATATRAHHLENPIGARLTSCTDPRRSWATSLLGRVLTVHTVGSFKPFSCVFCISFCVRSFALHSRISYFILAFYSRTSSPPLVYALVVAHLENVLSKNSFVNVAARVCCRQIRLRRLFPSSPSTVLNSLVECLVYINILSWPWPNRAI